MNGARHTECAEFNWCVLVAIRHIDGGGGGNRNMRFMFFRLRTTQRDSISPIRRALDYDFRTVLALATHDVLSIHHTCVQHLNS